MANQQVLQLIEKKDQIEAEIKELSEVLKSQGNVGMDGALIDGEGYPRSDIDIYSVRKARQRIICLRNDHKAIMMDIEGGLHQIHARARESQSSLTSSIKQDDTIDANLQPFIFVESVAAGSPAEKAGLQNGDEICEFGSLNAANFKSLQDVGYIVQHTQEKEVTVIVKQSGGLTKLTLVPRKWSGRGLLGCNVVPCGK